MQYVKHQRSLIRDAENPEVCRGGLGKRRILAPVNRGERPRRPHLLAINVRKPVAEKIVVERRIVPCGEIVEPQLIGMAEIMQAGGLSEIPKAKEIVP